MDKLLTIVVCTYNGQKFLSQVIDSILSQKDFEIIVDRILVVDNASTDNTKKIILDKISKVTNLEYIYEPRQGVSFARLHAVKAKSEWIAYLDDDNVVQNEWLTKAVEFIIQNPNLGSFNGASVGILEEPGSYRSKIFEYVYNDLACTHFSVDHYNSGYLPKIKRPIGAGLFIRTQPVINFYKSGWTLNTGRMGENLYSGEDGEIADSVLIFGYTHSYNNLMVLHHIIPSKRLDTEYLIRLYSGLSNGYYTYISIKKWFVILRIRSFLKALYKFVELSIKIKFKDSEIEREYMKLILLAKSIIIKSIIRDRLFIRSKN